MTELATSPGELLSGYSSHFRQLRRIHDAFIDLYEELHQRLEDPGPETLAWFTAARTDSQVESSVATLPTLPQSAGLFPDTHRAHQLTEAYQTAVETYTLPGYDTFKPCPKADENTPFRIQLFGRKPASLGGYTGYVERNGRINHAATETESRMNMWYCWKTLSVADRRLILAEEYLLIPALPLTIVSMPWAFSVLLHAGLGHLVIPDTRGVNLKLLDSRHLANLEEALFGGPPHEDRRILWKTFGIPPWNALLRRHVYMEISRLKEEILQVNQIFTQLRITCE